MAISDDPNQPTTRARGVSRDHFSAVRLHFEENMDHAICGLPSALSCTMVAGPPAHQQAAPGDQYW